MHETVRKSLELIFLPLDMIMSYQVLYLEYSLHTALLVCTYTHYPQCDDDDDEEEEQEKEDC